MFESTVHGVAQEAPLFYLEQFDLDGCGPIVSDWQPLDARDACCYEFDDTGTLCLPALSCDAFLSQADKAGYALVDSGASYGVAGVVWLKVLGTHLAERGLRPIIETVRQKFTGLGGHEQTAERR